MHDILLEVFKNASGETFTFEEIQSLIRQHYPEIKLTSILPYEHASGEKQGKYCKRCQQEPVFAKMGRGFYKVVVQSIQALRPAHSIHEKLVTALAGQPERVLTIYEIKELIQQHFPDTYLPSVIVSDHIKGGACKECQEWPLLARTSMRGCYKRLSQRHVKMAPKSIENTLQQTLLTVLNADPDRLFYQTPDLFAKNMQSTVGSGYRREISVLTAALRERIPFDILEFAALVPQEQLWSHLAQRLYDNCGIAEPFARWSVNSWATALQQRALAKAPSARPVQVNQTPAVYETQSVRIRSQECNLKKLTINNTETGYDALKKARRNVAMCLYLSETNAYLVGIHKPHVSAVLDLLKEPQMSLPHCPPEHARQFSLYGSLKWLDMRYSWFIGLSKHHVIRIFEQLDSQF